MRVLVVGPNGGDYFADSLVAALATMGVEHAAAGPAVRGVGHSRVDALAQMAAQRLRPLSSFLQRPVIAAASVFRPTLTLTVDIRLSRETISELRRLGSKVVLWFPDHVANLGRHDVFVAGYDRIYFKNPVLVSRLHGLYGLPVAYLPEGCVPERHSSAAPYASSGELVVVGNIHPTRAVLLQRLLDAGVRLRLYGAPPPPWVQHASLLSVHSGREVTLQEKADVFRTAVAVLNNLHPAEFGGTNQRLFEATAAGALVFTEEREGLRKLFEVPEEVRTFSTFAELLSLWEWATSFPGEAQETADRAAARSLGDHDYAWRLKQMFEDLRGHEPEERMQVRPAASPG